MIYPVAPEKIESFTSKIDRACEEAKIPQPQYLIPDIDTVKKEINNYRLGDYHLEHNGSNLYLYIRNRRFIVIDVVWPSPLRTLDNEETIISKDQPVGPNRLGMWAVLQYLP